MRTNLPPSLRTAPEELVGERIILRARCADYDLGVWDAVEESRAELSNWLGWVKNINHLEDCQQAGRRAMAQ